MSSNRIKILAASKEEWDEISDVVNAFPTLIKDQIEWAEKGLGGIKCHMNKIFSDKPKLNLPSTIRNISGESGSVWAYGPGYSFIARKEDFMYEFVFIDTN